MLPGAVPAAVGEGGSMGDTFANDKAHWSCLEAAAFGGRFRTGIERLDSRHQQMVQQLSALERAIQTRCSTEVICTFLSEFCDLAACHFEEEERVMEGVGYPRAAAHRQEHQRLLADLNAFGQQFVRDGTLPFPEVLGFLTDWVMQHMVDWDTDYLPYLGAADDTSTD